MKMKRVICTSIRPAIPNQIEVGKKYWIDEDSLYKGYVDVYSKEEKKEANWIGRVSEKHFETINRPLMYSGLSCFVNAHEPIMLKDIMDWCVAHGDEQIAEKIMLFVDDNKLATEDNMEKEYVVNHIPFRAYVEAGKEEEYSKYLGYDLYAVSA